MDLIQIFINRLRITMMYLYRIQYGGIYSASTTPGKASVAANNLLTDFYFLHVRQMVGRDPNKMFCVHTCIKVFGLRVGDRGVTVSIYIPISYISASRACRTVLFHCIHNASCALWTRVLRKPSHDTRRWSLWPLRYMLTPIHMHINHH